MRNCLAKILTAAVLMSFVFFGYGASVDAAQITRTLDENTRITPPGVIVSTRAEIPMFKKGTIVTLNEYSEVLEGILAEDISLPFETGQAKDTMKTNYMPPPMMIPYYINVMPTNRVLPFKGGTKVVFNDKGEVINGTISGSKENIILNLTNHIFVSEGEIIFHKNGIVATCTLASDSYLRTVGWSQIINQNFKDGTACSGFVEFKAKTPVKLNEKGEVIKGTLDKDTKLLARHAFSQDVVAIKVFEAGTTVEFDDKGVAVKVPKP